MTFVQKMMNPAASDSRFVAPVVKELKKSNVGLFQATKLSAKLVAGGAVEIAQGTVVSGAKFVEAVLLKFIELAGGNSDVRDLSGGAFKRSGAEANKAFKTALLLTTAFVGPIKPQWVAGVSEKLGLSAKEEHRLRRFWNTVCENKGKIGLGLLAVGTAGAVAYDLYQTDGYIATMYDRLTTDVKKLRQDADQCQADLSLTESENIELKNRECECDDEAGNEVDDNEEVDEDDYYQEDYEEDCEERIGDIKASCSEELKEVCEDYCEKSSAPL